MAKIVVTSEDLEQTAAQLRSAAEQIHNLNETAKGQVLALEGVWQGSANSAFEQAFATWKNGADQVDQSLARIGELLHSAASTYASTEQSITSSFG